MKFIYYYVNKDIFKKFITVHLKVKKSIYDKINTFSIYYERYIEWYNSAISGIKYNTDINTFEIENFDTIFNEIMKEIDSK